MLTASQPFTTRLAYSNIKWLKYEWNWEKDKGSNSANAKHQPLKALSVEAQRVIRQRTKRFGISAITKWVPQCEREPTLSCANTYDPPS